MDYEVTGAVSLPDQLFYYTRLSEGLRLSLAIVFPLTGWCYASTEGLQGTQNHPSRGTRSPPCSIYWSLFPSILTLFKYSSISFSLVGVILHMCLCRVLHYTLSWKHILFHHFLSDFPFICFIFNIVKRLGIFVFHNLQKSSLWPHKNILWTLPISCTCFKRKWKFFLNFQSTRCVWDYIIFRATRRFWLKVNGKIRSHHFTLSLIRINQTWPTGGAWSCLK